MKRRCPYCDLVLKGKELYKHIFQDHLGRGADFYCREGCVRCCTDPGAPLELVLSDIERISKGLDISCEDFFLRYGGVLWSSIPGTRVLIPATGLPFPCKFLKDGSCEIYEMRPLHCRLFPERLYIDPSPQEFLSFYRAGYECIDEGVSLGEERVDEVKDLMREDQAALERTAGFFRNEDYVFELSPSQYGEIQRIFREIDPLDPNRNEKRRKALEARIPEPFKRQVRDAFISRLRVIDKASKD
jgi:Fe-S-cluster containining protein